MYVLPLQQEITFHSCHKKGKVVPVLIHYVIKRYIKKYSRVEANANAFLAVKLVGCEW
jgi:hypothetical protein